LGAQGFFSNPQQLQQHNKTILESTKHAREDLGKESKRGGIGTFEGNRALNLKFNGGFNGAKIMDSGTHTKGQTFLASENSTNLKDEIANKTPKRKHPNK
jgi:hypothetical protein